MGSVFVLFFIHNPKIIYLLILHFWLLNSAKHTPGVFTDFMSVENGNLQKRHFAYMNKLPYFRSRIEVVKTISFHRIIQ